MFRTLLPPMPDTDPSPLALALGRLPCGLFIVSAQGSAGPVGFLGSLLTQVGFEPPTLCVAVGKERPHLVAIRDSGRFAVSVIDAESTSLLTPFFRPPADSDGTTPFDELATATTSHGSTVLSDALAWIDCRVIAEQETGDHVVVFGVAEEGTLLRAGDPKVHLRRNGLSY